MYRYIVNGPKIANRIPEDIRVQTISVLTVYPCIKPLTESTSMEIGLMLTNTSSTLGMVSGSTKAQLRKVRGNMIIIEVAIKAFSDSMIRASKVHIQDKLNEKTSRSRTADTTPNNDPCGRKPKITAKPIMIRQAMLYLSTSKVIDPTSEDGDQMSNVRCRSKKSCCHCRSIQDERNTYCRAYDIYTSTLTQLIERLAVPGDEWATENLGSYGYFR